MAKWVVDPVYEYANEDFGDVRGQVLVKPIFPLPKGVTNHTGNHGKHNRSPQNDDSSVSGYYV